MDRNDYYGGYFASFNLEALQGYAKKEISTDTNSVYESEALKLFLRSSHIENVDLKWLEEGDDSSPSIAAAGLLKNNRNFNIDLSPTLLYSLGGMVKLLISSNICRYVEFRSVDRVATLLKGEIKTVPCSRSDVFVTNEVNVVEKRIMMKLIETCMEFKEGEEDFESLKGKTFQEFLVAKKAPAKVQHYLIHALSMSTEETSFEKGVESLKKFVESLGRYGNSPFLFPMYGCGEIPQCFCRLCAVFGGIYCLQRGIKSIRESDEKVTLKLETDEEISVSNVIFGPKTMQSSVEEDIETHLARAIIISDQPLKDTNEKPKGGGVEFLRLTSESDKRHEAYLIQLSHYSGCCPKDVYLYHFISTTGKDVKPRDALQPFIDQIFSKGGKEEEKEKEYKEKDEKILFELFFTIPILKSHFKITPNIHSVGGPAYALDYDMYIEEAKEMFSKLYPDEEFLPRAPEPDEIVMEGYEDTDHGEEKEDNQLPEDEKVPTAEGDQLKGD